MPDLRKDPIVGRWVIIAAERAARPGAFLAATRTPSGEACPFCAGHEAETPPEVFCVRESPVAGPPAPWQVRVVPNKYPALVAEGSLAPRHEGMYERLDAVGGHEVIIESPEHVESTSDLSDHELTGVLITYRERLNFWRRDPRMRYGLIFKNVGAAAGASLEHTHSQLMVTPLVPVLVAEELAGALAFHRREGKCPFCEMIAQEQDSGERRVLETAGFVALVPFAARFPYETWILPRRHASHYEQSTDAQLAELAGVLRSVVSRIETVGGRPAYNYLLHTAPFDSLPLAHYHWHIEIIPCLTKAAGFEWGSGFHVNPMSPEESARRLRDVGQVINLS